MIILETTEGTAIFFGLFSFLFLYFLFTYIKHWFYYENLVAFLQNNSPKKWKDQHGSKLSFRGKKGACC